MPVEVLIRNLISIKFFLKRICLSKKLKLDLVLKKVNNINNFMKIIKVKYYFNSIIDIIVIDWLNKFYRFEIVYNLLNIYYNCRIYIIAHIQETTMFNHLEIKEDDLLFSITSIFQGSNWLERENWDMFGILFFNHPDLRRILTDYGFEGFPLRKDFPLTGFLELRYDEEQKTILYEKVELSQEFRFFDFESPWKHQ